MSNEVLRFEYLHAGDSAVTIVLPERTVVLTYGDTLRIIGGGELFYYSLEAVRAQVIASGFMFDRACTRNLPCLEDCSNKNWQTEGF